MPRDMKTYSTIRITVCVVLEKALVKGQFIIGVAGGDDTGEDTSSLIELGIVLQERRR